MPSARSTRVPPTAKAPTRFGFLVGLDDERPRSATVCVRLGRPTDDRRAWAPTACRRGRAAARGRRPSPRPTARSADRTPDVLAQRTRLPGPGPRRRRQLGCVVGRDDRHAGALPGDDVAGRPSTGRGVDPATSSSAPAVAALRRRGRARPSRSGSPAGPSGSSRRRDRPAAARSCTSTASTSRPSTCTGRAGRRGSWSRHGRGRRRGRTRSSSSSLGTARPPAGRHRRVPASCADGRSAAAVGRHRDTAPAAAGRDSCASTSVIRRSTDDHPLKNVPSSRADGRTRGGSRRPSAAARAGRATRPSASVRAWVMRTAAPSSASR